MARDYRKVENMLRLRWPDINWDVGKDAISHRDTAIGVKRNLAIELVLPEEVTEDFLSDTGEPLVKKLRDTP